ncbi:MAG: VOC family protein [Planctomycetes bacterium]|nr:VOC family protein [Planctomycetota bacterium]
MHPIRVERLDHLTVNVTDVERAKRFYAEVLGLKEVPRPASFVFPGAWYDAGPTLIHLVWRKEADPLSSRHLALWLSDVHAAAKYFEGQGQDVKWDQTKIPGVDRFFIRDPDGNLIELQGSDGTAG